MSYGGRHRRVSLSARNSGSGSGAERNPGFSAAAEKLLSDLKLPKVRLRQYRALKAHDRRMAAKLLWRELLERELKDFGSRAGNPPILLWWRFINVKTYSHPETASKVISALGLGAAEEEKLKALLLRGKFEDVEPLKRPAREHIKIARLEHYGIPSAFVYLPGRMGTVPAQRQRGRSAKARC